jgi:hypothetical protein
MAKRKAEVVEMAASPAAELSAPVPRPGQISGQGPDRYVMLRSVIRAVVDMRDLDGPQRARFKCQVAAYALLEGPKLPRDLVAILLEVSGPTINHYATATKPRMLEHRGFELYVEGVTADMKARFALLE